MRRARRRNLPANPVSLEDFNEVPGRFQRTLRGENFLICDSDDVDEEIEGRVLVFATRRNLEILSSSPTWFLDGTFKVSPNIFVQVS